MAYTNQRSAWFDKNVTNWWIRTVFILHHASRHGHSHCILLLDNFSGHMIDQSRLPDWLHILFLPPKMTNTYQPADMGMIAALKVGYKATMLRMLLDIFDEPGGYEAAAEQRKKMPKGKSGLSVGGKAHIVDVMMILHNIWSKDAKYARVDGIVRCWRKASILPLEMENGINQSFGSLTIPMSKKLMSAQEQSQLCEMMAKIQLNVRQTAVNCNTTAVALQGSFADEPIEYTQADYGKMIENWADIEDQPEVLNAVIEECIDDLEMEQEEEVAANEERDDAEPEQELPQQSQLSFAQMQSMLFQLSENASAHNINPMHLHNAMKDLRAGQQNKKKKATTLHSFFQPRN
jgi:DDE superfamily endonuclease